MRHVILVAALVTPLTSRAADRFDLASRGAETAARPGVIAHRGVALEAPENTLPAIAKAIDLGCALAEIDLRYTADGEVVLVHDDSVDRTTDGTGRVAEKTLAELRALDAGAHQGPAFRGTRIPTLREAVERARGRIQLYLDLKEPDPRPVVRVIEQLGARSMVVYRPYTYVALQQILEEAPSSRVLIDLGDWLQAPGLLDTLGRDLPTGAISSDWKNWKPHAVAEARRLRIPTFVNVLGAADTPDNLRAAAALGFDYIQTDHPRQLLEILGDRGTRDYGSASIRRKAVAVGRQSPFMAASPARP